MIEEIKHKTFYIEKDYLTIEVVEYKKILEILDEIQRLITDLQWESYAIENKKFTGHRDCVYEMPKE